jgi:hypothetical protein
MSSLSAMPRGVVVGSLTAALIGIAGLVACGPDTITQVGVQVPTGANLNVTPASARTLTVCTGDGPPGTYTYQLSDIVLGAGTRGTLSTPLGTTFSVPLGGCVDAAVLSFPSIVGETDIPTSITVTEIGRPAATNFKYIQATILELQSPTDVCLAPANFPCGQDTQIFTPSTALVINEFHGSVAAYFHEVVTPPTGKFTTFTQGGWGSIPRGNNPGQLLKTNFSVVYPTNSVSVGGTKTLTFTSAAAITKFLPQGSTPAILAASATNPATSAAGVFAGQILALRLSVDFSAAGVTTSGLGAMRITSGKLVGTTVSDALALANSVLGGNVAALPSGVTISDLNSIIDSINNNYDGGTTNNGYLAP